MKMLKTLFCVLVLGILFPIIASAQATSKNIPLQADKDDVQNRSLLPQAPVFASMKGTLLYSEFVMAIGGVSIVVTDQSGKVVVQKSLIVMGELKDTISLTDLPKGTYKVCYLTDRSSFYGTFDLE